MVAKITVPGSIKRALNYNEQKVKEGAAECLYAHRFFKEAGHLNFSVKLARFTDLIALNKRAMTNTVHVSLNFAEGEKLGKKTLTEIASLYMDRIGFGEQPYLVYQHHDAGHPHIHIVTTNIQKDGRRISLHNLGRNASNDARKEIEIKYNLVKAEAQKNQNVLTIKPLNAQRVAYGKTPTKRAITNVLDVVLPVYKYASLPELNAVLQLYNVIADRGKEEGIIFKNRGLVYRVMDEKGGKVGVPIKASSIYNKPTLHFLQKKFAQNEVEKPQHKKSLKNSIDFVLLKGPKNVDAFRRALEKEKITLITRQNDSGLIYGLTYIDHNSRCVFNGSEIGKQYSAKGILQRCKTAPFMSVDEKHLPPQKLNTEAEIKHRKQEVQDYPVTNVIDALLTPIEQSGLVPFQLKKQRKKKRKF